MLKKNSNMGEENLQPIKAVDEVNSPLSKLAFSQYFNYIYFKIKLKTMKRIAYVLLISVSSLAGCAKCYECTKATSSSSSKQGACFDKSSEARQWKKDMEDNGFDCRVVPEP